MIAVHNTFSLKVIIYKMQKLLLKCETPNSAQLNNQPELDLPFRFLYLRQYRAEWLDELQEFDPHPEAEDPANTP